MAQIVLNFSPELMERLEYWSGKKNNAPEVLVMNILKEQLEDWDDYEEAVKISREIRAGRMKTYSLEEVEKEFELEN